MGGPLEPYITVDQWVKMVERFIALKAEADGGDVVTHRECVQANNNDDDRVNETGEGFCLLPNDDVTQPPTPR